jgi:hypothetical protein
MDIAEKAAKEILDAQFNDVMTAISDEMIATAEEYYIREQPKEENNE